MANWEVNKTKRYNKPIEEHDAKIRGQAFRIEASEGSDKGVLYLWNDLRGYERIAYGSVADLKRQAEGMGKREARGVAAIERRSNYSRPGAKHTMAVEDRFYFGKGRKERFADDHAAAGRRVQSNFELRRYAKIIMQDEFDSAEHWRWVSTAPVSEIVSWAKEIASGL
jgi:hypothetical protein